MQERLTTGRGPRLALIGIVVAGFVLLFGIRWAASLALGYAWWNEMGQVDTWVDLYAYSALPTVAGTVLLWIVLLVVHWRAVHFTGGKVSDYPIYSRLSSLALLVVAFLGAGATIDAWTIMRFLGSRSIPAVGWKDPIFGQTANFYLFDLPFWNGLRSYIFGMVVLAILIYWLVARGWQLRFRLHELQQGQIDLSFLRLEGGMESRFLRGAAAFFFLMIALRYYLSRFEMAWETHRFMVGVDYTADHFTLPLYWVVMGALVVGAVMVMAGRWMTAAITVGGSLALVWIVPAVASSLFVKPNEISLERPYIEAHIEATRQAWGLSSRMREVEMRTNPAAVVDTVKNRVLLDNVRLWDWKPFHDTVTQMQALRPYYAFHDADVDRYVIDGAPRQVLLSPREIDINQLPGAQSSWINPHFIYTHGYGLVLAEVAKISPEGQPRYLIQDMPPAVNAPGLKLERPELYYGELTHEPVFVDTAQQEFNYPQGSENALTRYAGKGGFPISSFALRLAAALDFGDSNIILTGYLTDHSRMMIHRRVRERLQTLAPYLQWDHDPYLVITPEGRMVWMVDAYTTSESHPFSRQMDVFGGVNYIRNSVKATVDAYDGETHLYIFDKTDPLIAAWQALFPKLYEDAAKMPVGLRPHVRYPEEMFRAQSSIYRVYHMRNPQAFYNNEDIWELSRYVAGQNAQPQPVDPTYVFATLPGESKPEFLLMTTFTPLSKENLIGVMLARCDAEHLGEVVVLQLSKQELILGPMQVNARINQDQNISKDLTLWNQQGSQVLQGQTLVLPMGETFLYISPIYLQATQARMPQLKKVVLAVGNRLIYSDSYEQALAQLSGGVVALPVTPDPVTSKATPNAPQVPTGDPRIDSIRRHLDKYRELSSQGKWSEAGRELEAIQTELRQPESKR